MQLSVRVFKSQSSIDASTIDLFHKGEHVLYKTVSPEVNTNKLVEKVAEQSAYVKIELPNASRIKIVFADSGQPIKNYFADGNGNFVGDEVLLFEGVPETTVTIPDGAKFFFANYEIGREYSIFVVA